MSTYLVKCQRIQIDTCEVTVDAPNEEWAESTIRDEIIDGCVESRDGCDWKCLRHEVAILGVKEVA